MAIKDQVYNWPVDSCPDCGGLNGIHYFPCQAKRTAAETAAPTGWLCPRCGRGNAPHNPTCPCVDRYGTW